MTGCHTEFLQKLKKARLNAGLTQQVVSKALHCTQSALSKKESGDRPFYAWELVDLCKMYGISLRELKTTRKEKETTEERKLHRSYR